jgi:hypothetical protein
MKGPRRLRHRRCQPIRLKRSASMRPRLFRLHFCADACSGRVDLFACRCCCLASAVPFVAACGFRRPCAGSTLSTMARSTIWKPAGLAVAKQTTLVGLPAPRDGSMRNSLRLRPSKTSRSLRVIAAQSVLRMLRASFASFTWRSGLWQNSAEFIARRSRSYTLTGSFGAKQRVRPATSGWRVGI